MAKCERAELLKESNINIVKFCNECTRTAGEPTENCLAIGYLKMMCRIASEYPTRVDEVGVISSVAKIGEMRNTKTFTFEVCTTVGHYAVVAPTYAEAMQLVRDETREPVRSCRKCSE